MLLNRFIAISVVLGLLIILLTLRGVRRGWTRQSERIRRRLEAGRILRRAERVPARTSVQVMGNATSADLRVALVLTESELHFFLHSDGDLARRATGAPFHVLLAPAARDRRDLALAEAPAARWRGGRAAAGKPGARQLATDVSRRSRRQRMVCADRPIVIEPRKPWFRTSRDELRPAKPASARRANLGNPERVPNLPR